MKGLKWKRFAKLGVLLMSLFAIIATSLVNITNTYADELSVLVEPIGYSGTGFALVGSGCSMGSDGTYAYNNTSYACAVTTVTGSLESLGWGVNNNYYIKFVGYVYDLRDKEEINAYINSTPNLQVTYSGNTPQSYNATLVDVSANMVSNDSAQISFIFRLNVPNNYGVIYSAVLRNVGIGLQPNEYFAVGGWYLYLSKNLAPTTNVNIDTQSIVNAINNADNAQAINNQTQKIEQQTEAINDVKDSIDQQNQQDQHDRQDLQDTQSDADTSADGSSQQAEATGSTLLQAFTSFVGALTSANPSDCSIDFNIMGYINGGRVNLCQLSLPPAFQAIGSLILIGFCVPLSIATGRKVIELFKSFQR